MSETGIWIGAYPVPPDAEAIAAACGGDPARLHLTLGYLNFATTDPPPSVTPVGFARELRWLAHQVPCGGTIDGRAVFYRHVPGEPHHRVLLVNAPELNQARAWLVQFHSGWLDDTYPWIPHITVGDTQDDVPDEWRRPVQIEFDRIVLHWGRATYPILTRPRVETAPPL